MHEKRGSIAGFENKKANYKYTRITLNGAVLAPFLSLLEHVLVCWDILRNNKLAGNLKEICIKQSSAQ